MNPSLELCEHQVDVCVVGGGMTGLIAAVAAARHGSRVVLIHDRPVLGGNASSEVRMHIKGALGPNMRESGILEEIKLVNRHRNPKGSFAVWDSVLFEFAKMTPGLTTLLNCTCNDAIMEDGKIASVNAWQMTTQQWHRVSARYFIDCSGDSILAPLSGADTRSGRESREEFGESLAPNKADLKTMGNSILMQLEETSSPQPFQAPEWAYSFDDESTLPSRVGSTFGHNFWWIELGGLQNTISDAETIRDELVKTVWGIWDYMKNKGPQAEKLTNWRMTWMGALPGKRENRRYLSDFIMTQHDIDEERKFDDIVAYGGWSMDDHHPAGLYYPGKPTIFHKAPSPYGIPYRVLYSRNVPNLFCAGRNISATHTALSSTRVMGTCSILGQAVGTAAAICVERSVMPKDVSGELMTELQKQLMDDDCWLPGLSKVTSPLMSAAQLSATLGSVDDLLDGHERIIDDVDHAWVAPVGESVSMTWESPRKVECLRLVFDSDLSDDKDMPKRYSLSDPDKVMPPQLVKSFRVEVQLANDSWEVVYREEENRRRLVVVPIRREVKAIRLVGDATWGGDDLRVFGFEAYPIALPLTLDPPAGISWVDVVDGIPSEDLQEPDHGLENATPGKGRVGA